jgi:O-antigen/teichoic acid export membrane protein
MFSLILAGILGALAEFIRGFTKSLTWNQTNPRAVFEELIRVSYPFLVISFFINWPCTITDDFIVKYTTNINVFDLLYQQNAQYKYAC